MDRTILNSLCLLIYIWQGIQPYLPNGTNALCAECSHFNSWVTQLEGIVSGK